MSPEMLIQILTGLSESDEPRMFRVIRDGVPADAHNLSVDYIYGALRISFDTADTRDQIEFTPQMQCVTYPQEDKE